MGTILSNVTSDMPPAVFIRPACSVPISNPVFWDFTDIEYMKLAVCIQRDNTTDYRTKYKPLQGTNCFIESVYDELTKVARELWRYFVDLALPCIVHSCFMGTKRPI